MVTLSRVAHAADSRGEGHRNHTPGWPAGHRYGRPKVLVIRFWIGCHDSAAVRSAPDVRRGRASAVHSFALENAGPKFAMWGADRRHLFATPLLLDVCAMRDELCHKSSQDVYESILFGVAITLQLSVDPGITVQSVTAALSQFFVAKSGRNNSNSANGLVLK